MIHAILGVVAYGMGIWLLASVSRSLARRHALSYWRKRRQEEPHGLACWCCPDLQLEARERQEDLAQAEREVDALLDLWTNGPKEPAKKPDHETQARMAACIAAANSDQARLLMGNSVWSTHQQGLLNATASGMANAAQGQQDLATHQGLANVAHLAESVRQDRLDRLRLEETMRRYRPDNYVEDMVLWNGRYIPREELEAMELIMRGKGN